MVCSAAEADPLTSIYIGFGERIDQEVLTRLSRTLKVRRRIDHASVAHRRRTLVASIRIRVSLIVMWVIVGCNRQVSHGSARRLCITHVLDLPSLQFG